MLKESILNNIENKTNVKKETILSLANKLKHNNWKNEDTIKEIINELCTITGKHITKEKEEKIIKAIVNEQIPKNIEKMF